MPGIIPVPTSRTSDILLQNRLLGQIQFDQRALLTLQTQLSTGRRVLAPSDDAPAAIRGITLQRLLEQKDQIQTNLNTSGSYLTAADSAISGVSQLISQVRGESLALLNSTTSDTQRSAIREQVQRTLQQLVDVGNQKFRGRYLFAGSRAGEIPFEFVNDGRQVAYRGNERELKSFSDIGLLFESSVSGHEVFGAISPEVRGSIDLNPVLTSDTRLAELRGGIGVTRGSFAVSDGTNSVTIDIATAETIGDVVRLIESQPPPGREITVRITSAGLEVSIDSAGGGNLSIREIGGGTTAAELGIFSPLGVGTATIVGADLNPQLTLTSKLDDLLGSRARAAISSVGPNNDILIEARERGAAANAFTLQFVDDSLVSAAPGITAGNEFATLASTATAARASLALSGTDNDLILTAVSSGTSFNNVSILIDSSQNLGNAAAASYNASTKTLTLAIDDSDETTLDTLVAAINGSGAFTAAADNSAGEGYNGSAVVSSANGGTTSGNTGNTGGAANTLFVHIEPGRTTAKHVVEALRANVAFDAIFDVQFDSKDSAISLDEGTGLVNTSATATTAGGSGEEFDANSGLRIVNGGQTHVLEFSQATTVEDLLIVLNGSNANVVASINAAGTGIDIRSLLSGSDFQIGENGGQTATQLGVRSFTRATTLNELNYGRGVEQATGTDFTITRADGVSFDIDISGALSVGDVLDLINNHPANLNPATQVVARLAETGNGIELFDGNSSGSSALTITKAFVSPAAWDLGLLPRSQSQVSSSVGPGAAQTITGSDVNPLETEGIFNSLLRLDFAIESGNVGDVQRAIAALDDDLSRVNFARAEVGARGQSVDASNSRLSTEEVELRASLSDEIDVDFVKAVSELAAKQAAVEASLQLISRTFQLSLLNFL